MTTRFLKIKNIKTKLFFGLTSCLLLVLIGHIYLINNVVFGLAGYESLLEKRSQLVLELGQLETDYLKDLDGITVEWAYGLGYEDAGNRSSYLALVPTSLALNSSTNEEHE